jgi:hypothetical protein
MVARFVPQRTGAASLRRARLAALLAALAVIEPAAAAGSRPAQPAPPADDAVVHARAARPGGAIPARFVGLSLEWTLVDRYMGPRARPVFAQLLRNLGSGILRVGGGSADVSRFRAHAADSVRDITPADLAAIRATLAAADPSDPPRWGVVLATAMTPATRPASARAFATRGVARAFAGAAARRVAGIELGNEPDVSYRYDLRRYLHHLAAFPRTTGPFMPIGPSTSEPVALWRSRAGRGRFFADWPAILAASAPATRRAAGGFGAWAADHFYPTQRLCATAPYRCATIARLLSPARLANLDNQVYAHAGAAARYGLGYRLEEINSAAGRGAAGVSDTAASATWALSAMFHAACPQPPSRPGANADCHTGAVGVNFHDAEIQRFFASAQGNAYYNPIAYDLSAAEGAPHPAPEYYALLLFARFAQGQSGLRPVVSSEDRRLDIWELSGGRRLFLINRSGRPLTVAVGAPGSAYALDRMTPFDPTGARRGLRAAQERIDGRAVAADGTWPGFRPRTGVVVAHRLRVALTPGEAAVLTFS